MMTAGKKTLAGVLVLAVVFTFLSAMLGSVNAQPLTNEAVAVRGDQCATAWGLGLGLAAASLSPCGVVCAVGAWYSLALIASYC